MYYHIVSTENSRLLKIENIGYSGDPKNNRFGPGKRNMYLIHYVFSGKGYYNGKPVVAGQGFLIRPETHEWYYPDADDPWEFLWITSFDPVMEEIFQQFNPDDESQIFEYNYIPAVSYLTKQIKQNHNKNYSASKILEIFLNLFNHQKKTKTVAITDMYFTCATNYISANRYRCIRVSELVNILGITQPYLYNIFMKKCHLSPKQYIDTYKVGIAQDMLSDTATSISEIAYSLGFKDPFVFSRFFKKNTGISPSKFRTDNIGTAHTKTTLATDNPT